MNRPLEEAKDRLCNWVLSWFFASFHRNPDYKECGWDGCPQCNEYSGEVKYINPMDSGETAMKDVIAVRMDTIKVRLLAENKDEASADAIMKMAIARRGLDDEFYAVVDHGKYKEGDKYE